ncbi:MAG: YitT family protein [Eubacteriales bacterium]|nr:YitT family protein [Eubacteriales bacterium]
MKGAIRERDVKLMMEQFVFIIVGTFLMSAAVVQYFDQISVVAGGVTGLSILLKSLYGIPMWVVNAFVNIPLFIIGYRLFDRFSFIKTVVGTSMLTIFLGGMPRLDLLTDDLLVNIIIGSVLMGSGLGLIFLAQASSGGVDLLATILNRYVRYISIPKLMALIDGVIIVAGMAVFGLIRGIYALIAIYIVTRVSDTIVEGPKHARLLYVISCREEECAHYIMKELERGVTFIPVTGAYTGRQKRMIMCVVSGKEMVKIKQNIYRIDEKAICFVGDICEAFGEGFTKFED